MKLTEFEIFSQHDTFLHLHLTSNKTFHNPTDLSNLRLDKKSG